MAAWAGRIDAIADDGGGNVQLTVTYWLATDTTFTSRLGGTTFSFPSSWSLSDAQSAIIAKGQAIRAGQATSASLASRVGTTVQVP